ncbi:hypothetical protein SAMN04489725_1332 [Alicyclobacillus hesperidum]|uniref:Uncharacterized protein n=1 Tax=Alicyclobacillus hesperidum TaxID=89784 RepID=A0A1H2YED2_9BACL|nr:hypothetical protein [Alicyclobacillus hesperidum]SDX02909.1 hypothetical protein SAMN04489725_1332 [Alicyclobacillus hesperidum]
MPDQLDSFWHMKETTTPEELVGYYLDREEIAACSAAEYMTFCQEVSQLFSGVEAVRIMGSGNWGFSLNPDKNLKEFDQWSDIDTVIISPVEFNDTWSELRKFHRSKWYVLNKRQRDELNRNGQNIYAGFVSPLWIPQKGNRCRYRFIQILQSLRSDVLGSRKVNALFFKSREEVIDYYKRGVVKLRGGKTNGL